jgi:hypothetical protein
MDVARCDISSMEPSMRSPRRDSRRALNSIFFPLHGAAAMYPRCQPYSVLVDCRKKLEGEPLQPRAWPKESRVRNSFQ